MGNYTSKTQKIEMYSEKYSLPKAEIKRILSEHEDLLTLEELKIKYDNPNIGVLPEWLSEEELDKMIWKTIHECWNDMFAIQTTKEDMYMHLQEYVRKKINLYKNHAYLKGSLVLRIRSLIDINKRRSDYFTYSLDEVYTDENSSISIKRYKYEPSENLEELDSYKEYEICEKIKSIKDKSIQNVLIITGYLLCGIDELRGEYLQLLRNSDASIKESIKLLEDNTLYNDNLDHLKFEGIKVKGVKKKRVTILDIMKALKVDKFNLKASNSSVKQELAQYLDVIGFKDLLTNI